MENKSKVSVALACYNGSKYIERQLKSILVQDISLHEIIIVDDVSSDNSVAIIENLQIQYPEIKLYKNRVNVGPIKTFKKAISFCTGQFIALSDQDDVWLPNKISVCLKLIKKLDNSKPLVVFSDLTLVDEFENLISSSFWNKIKMNPENISFTDIVTDNVITGCTALINTKMGNELIAINDEILMHDHWMAMIAYSWGDYSFTNQPLVRYRAHSESVTNKDMGNPFINLVKDFHRKDYLKSHIVQGELFYQTYKHLLNEDQQKILKSLIKLKSSWFITKRFWRLKKKVKRNMKKYLVVILNVLWIKFG